MYIQGNALCAMMASCKLALPGDNMSKACLSSELISWWIFDNRITIC